MDVFVSKVRPIGSSLCAIIPKKVAESAHLKPGKEIEFAIINRDFRGLERLFGSVKEKVPFERDRRDRV